MEINSIQITLQLDTEADVMVITETTSRVSKAQALCSQPMQLKEVLWRWLRASTCINSYFQATICRNQKKHSGCCFCSQGLWEHSALSPQTAEDMGLVEYHIEQTTKAPAGSGGGMASHTRHD